MTMTYVMRINLVFIFIKYNKYYYTRHMLLFNGYFSCCHLMIYCLLTVSINIPAPSGRLFILFSSSDCFVMLSFNVNYLHSG